MKFKSALFLSLSISGIISSANGLITTPVKYQTPWGGQSVLIRHFYGIEELTIFCKAKLNPYRSSLLIIPVPNYPSILPVILDLLKDMSRLTAPVRVGMRRMGGCIGHVATDFFEHTDYYSLDYYELLSAPMTNVLATYLIHTDQPESLSNWITSKGYLATPDLNLYFQEYIDKGWKYFVAVKTDSGMPFQACGINLIFSSADPVLPAQITRTDMFGYDTTYDQRVPIYITVIANQKMFFSKSNLKYANRISDEEYQEIKRDFNKLAQSLAVGNFITKLERRYGSPSEINEDIYLIPADDDGEYREIIDQIIYEYYHAGNGLLWLVLLGPVYYLFRRRRIF
ncbi:MAG: DUF2330 domain-containing protein [candidate division WOR-3 bacterium]